MKETNETKVEPFDDYLPQNWNLLKSYENGLTLICTDDNGKMHIGILFSQTVNLHDFKKEHQHSAFFERFPTPNSAVTQPDKLKYFRLKNKFSKAAVAEYLGCTEKNYARYECTEHGFSSLWLVLKLSQLYGIDPYLLADEYHSFLLKGQAEQRVFFKLCVNLLKGVK